MKTYERRLSKNEEEKDSQVHDLHIWKGLSLGMMGEPSTMDSDWETASLTRGQSEEEARESSADTQKQ